MWYSEISNFNPQTRYFHKKVNLRLFKKCCFWGCDVENWVWAKLSLWICRILWIRVKNGYTQLSATFFDHYRPNRPIYQKIKKIIFFQKNAIFLVENLPEKGQNWSNTTFPNIFLLISAESADLSKKIKKKIVFSKKLPFFNRKSVLEASKRTR